MAGPMINLDSVQAAVLEFVGSFDGEPVKQAQIEDHITQEGRGPLPMEALEKLVAQGVLENTKGPATPASNGEPTVMHKDWLLTPYGERVLERYLENKARGKAAADAKPAKAEKPEDSQKRERSDNRFKAGLAGRNQVRVKK